MNQYASWYTEIHTYQIGFEVTRKIAAHLAMRVAFGGAVIVCDTPRTMLPAFRKRWAHILRRLECDRAATMNKDTKVELKRYAETLEHTQFVLEQPDERYTPTVWLTEPDDFNHIPKGIATIYVMSELNIEQLFFWARQTEDDSVVVLFRKKPLAVAGREG